MTMTAAADILSKTEAAHAKFREGKYQEAIELYTEALAGTKIESHRVALHSNRAACYLKLQKFKQAAEECTAVLELDDQHTGALMLRAQTLVMLQDYHSALFDVNRLIYIDPSSQAYRGLQSRIKTQLALDPIPEAESEEDSAPRPNSPNKTNTTTVVVVKPKPLDYSRWNNIGDDLSSDEEEDKEDQPQYKYRLKTIGLRAASY